MSHDEWLWKLADEHMENTQGDDDFEEDTEEEEEE